MRVIGGVYRGRRLKSPFDAATRPTSDRLRETLFNILATRLHAARFADLCAGTGAVGIEALSRGAAHVTFVDKSRRACALIRQNLAALQIPATAYEIECRDARDYVKRTPRTIDDLTPQSATFDLAFYDPPYSDDYLPVLQTFAAQPTCLAANALLVVEHFHKHDLPGAIEALRCQRRLKQGDSALSFYEFDYAAR